MIEVSSLTRCYGDFTAGRDPSFTVPPGEVIGLVGPNGADKTTTLRCCTGVIPPTRGAVASSLVLLGKLAAVVRWPGGRYERFDLSTELSQG
jgi:ABC-type multidrug transport system ATPase subunit